MRHIREILRLRHEAGATDRMIARSLGIARSTVGLTLERVAAAGLSWPLPATLTDRVLEAMLYASNGARQGAQRKAEPDWICIHHERRRAGVTLLLLWEEYRGREPGGYGYSRWCELYRDWENRLSPTMRQSHPAGERLFVDYAGQRVDVIDGRTGEIRAAQIFVAAMGASNYTYAEATWTQTLPDWIGAHVRALAFMGGVPAQLVPDNPKVGVERWILARLRNRRFFSLAELNQAISELVADLNTRPMRRLGVSRRDLFLDLDRPTLKPLPVEPYEYAEWRVRRVGLDYHVDIDGHYYSAPHRLIRQQLDARITARTIELFCKGERVAVHMRGGGGGGHTTIAEHMPSAHRRYAEWTIERIRRDAAAIGPSTAKLVTLILESRPHPEQGYRACIGILRLARHYGAERLEAACDRGLDIGARSYGSIQSILKHGLDRRPPKPAAQGELALDHPNIRGSRYYH